MNNEQVAHLWANKSRTSARGSSFYFEGDTIYSYGSHFPIARHYRGVILFTTKTYSVTTARHIGIAHSACHHLPVFTVADVMRNPCGEDIRDYTAQIKTASEALARKRDPEFAVQSLERLVSEANRFCETFGFKTRFAMPDAATLAALKEKSKVAAAKKAKATAARNAQIAKENAEAIAQWLNGEARSIPYTVQVVYLRVKVTADQNNDNATIFEMETSKGARVPLAEAEKAFRFAQLKRSTGWHRNGDTFKVGEFQLDAVNEFGVVAGCHRVAWNEIERFAKLQGWI